MPLIVAAYAAMCAIWGSTWLVIKVGLAGAPPGTALGLRFLLAAAIVLVLVRARRIPIPRRRHFWALSAFLGVFQLAMPYTLVYWSEQHLSSGLTAVLYTSMPLMVALLARAALRTPLTPPKLAGIGLGIAGVAVIFSDSIQISGASQVRGVVAVLVSVFLASISAVGLKKHGGRYHPVAALLGPFAIGGTLVTLGAVASERSNPLHYDARTWATILYLASAGSVVAFTLFFWVVKRVDVTVASYQTFVIPVVAVILGSVFLAEPVSPRLVAGGLLILVAIALATLVRARR
jgi:putative membrane protein PagO